MVAKSEGVCCMKKNDLLDEATNVFSLTKKQKMNEMMMQRMWFICR